MKRKSGLSSHAGPLRAALEGDLGLTPSEAEAVLSVGGAYVEGRRAQSGAQLVAAGARLLAVLEESGRAAQEQPAPAPALRVLFEDARVLAVDKPAGLAAQPTPARRDGNLLSLASAHLGREAGLVHRLDKDTTGVTLFGKTKEATRELAAAFREGRAKKTYLAAAGGALPDKGTIDLPLSKDPSRPGRWRASKQANGLLALTGFERLGEGEGYALVALFPQTGRTHQLRAHLAALGAPIVGDALYGGPRVPPAPGAPLPQRCLLHAFRLELDGQRFEAPLPQDLAPYFSGRASTPLISGR